VAALVGAGAAAHARIARRRARAGRREHPAATAASRAGFEDPRRARRLGYGGPGLRAVPGPARWILGRPGRGGPLWAPADANVLVLGPARSRKSSGALLPQLRRWPGGALVTSTRPEVLGWVRAHRADRPIAVFDPAGVVGAPEAAAWRPWDVAIAWDRAVSVAHAMTAGMEAEGGVTNARHFAERAAHFLAPLLHAAALCDAEVGQVRRWASGHDLEPVVALLREHGAATAAADLAAFVAEPDDSGGGKAGTLATAARAVAWTARDAVRESLAPDRPPLDLEGLVRARGTLVVVSPPQLMEELAPLMVGLISAVAGTGQALAFSSPGGRLAAPFGFMLDEVATIAPWSGLAAHMATGAGSGMPSFVVAQDLAQLARRWGPDGAQTIWNNATVKLITRGAADEQTDRAAARQGGEVLVTRRSGGASRGRSDHLIHEPGRGNLGTNVGWQEAWEPVLRQGELARVPLGSAMCLAAGLRPMVLELVGRA
jgi:type IV secretory pathway TraG/TraD family ATPase VirD4